MRKKYIIDKEDLHKLIKGEALTLTNDNAFSVKVNGTLTNGDVIEAVFPDAIIGINENGICVNVDCISSAWWIRTDWWNAPYGGEKR